MISIFQREFKFFEREVNILTQTSLEITTQNAPAKLSHFTVEGIKVVLPDYHDPITSRTYQKKRRTVWPKFNILRSSLELNYCQDNQCIVSDVCRNRNLWTSYSVWEQISGRICFRLAPIIFLSKLRVPVLKSNSRPDILHPLAAQKENNSCNQLLH